MSYAMNAAKIKLRTARRIAKTATLSRIAFFVNDGRCFGTGCSIYLHYQWQIIVLTFKLLAI